MAAAEFVPDRSIDIQTERSYVPNSVERKDAMEECAPGLEQFHQARSEFRYFLVAKEELRWRVKRLLPANDKCRKKVEQLLSDSGVSAFQSCADECACRFVDCLPDGRFPGFNSFIDVFMETHQG